MLVYFPADQKIPEDISRVIAVLRGSCEVEKSNSSIKVQFHNVSDL